MKNILLFILIVLPFISQSQFLYQVGTSSVSIEPDLSLISLHLGGYGAPRDGRFTLQWVKKQPISGVVTIGGGIDRLFVISNGVLMRTNPDEKNNKWQKTDRIPDIISIAGTKDKLFAISKGGILLESKVHSIKWKKLGTVDNSATAITASGDNLFVSNNDGTIWSTDHSAYSGEWQKHDAIKNIISLSSNNEKLFALTNNGTIYQYPIKGNDQKWMKLAYKNEFTITEDIKHIAIVNNKLWGISNDGFLYSGEHRSEKNLTARAMAVKSNDQTVVIVNVDVCGLNDTFVGLLKSEVYKKWNIPSAAVFINSSHTHFAPVSQNWLTWQEPNQRPDSIYLNQVVKNGILNAIDKALDSMAPAELAFGRGKTDIGYNRTLKNHPELYDGDVDVIQALYNNGEKNYLFLTACHPVFSTTGTLHYTISANFPGVARKLVEERTRTSNSLFLQGTAGDINPKDNGEYITGEKLANEVIAVINRPMKKINGPISFALDTINFPVNPMTQEEILTFKEQNKDKIGDVEAEKNVKWCDLMLKYKKEGTMPASMPVYVQTINIGNWKLVGFSREATTGYSFGVKNLWPDKLVSVAGYTNDVSSYLPTSMHIADRGYEGLDSFFWYGMPNVFPSNVDTIILEKVKALAR
jgi:hypothetical protein